MVCEGLKLNLFVGSKIGTFKHVRYDQSSKRKRKDTTRQLQDVKCIQKGEGISCMAFKDLEQTEILLGKENRIIQTYNLLTDQFTKTYDVDFGEGMLRSLSVYEDTFLGAVESGIVKVWKSKSVSSFELNAGADLQSMRHCSDNSKLIATGGKENDLKIWDLEKQETVFQAKNVPHDWLQLRVPIWISDICFLPETDGKQIAISSRYGVVRLYDTRTQRRPVCSVEFQGQANTCISTGFRERQVLVGTGRGILQMVDLRNSGKPDKSYKGATGSISAALCLAEKGVIVSTSLDRHLRIHNSESKETIHKQYMTTKLTSFLIRSSDKTPLPHELLHGDAEVKDEEIKQDIDFNSDNKSDSEFEEIFNNMQVIGDKNKKKKTKHMEHVIEIANEIDDELEPVTPKPMKKSKKHKLKEASEELTNGDSATVPDKKKRKKAVHDDNNEIVEEESPPVVDQLNESIKKLLKSTEKRKKVMEKKKIEKKRRSVFNS